MEVTFLDYSCPYSEIGPLAMPGRYRGSGLCEECQAKDGGEVRQVVTVHRCTNGRCDRLKETWVSGRLTSTTSSYVQPLSATVWASSTDVYAADATDAITSASTCIGAPRMMTFDVTVTKTVAVTTTSTVWHTVEAGS